MVTDERNAPFLRASTEEDLFPLIAMCRAGRLGDVQEWIASGKPVNLPLWGGKKTRRRTPLDWAVAHGFHSLVETLLKGGADYRTLDRHSPMPVALQSRRLDLAKLLVEHGFDVRSVDMTEVFAAWEPELMEYFIDQGADVETGMPLAEALCEGVRTALCVFRKYRDRFPTFQEQANVALRHHCKEGNLKWVSLLLWAGADPYAPGEAEPGRVTEPDDEGLSALGFAALYDRYDVFDVKTLRLKVDDPAIRDVLQYSLDPSGAALIGKLLELGVEPNDQANGGSSYVQTLLERVGDYGDYSTFDRGERNRRGMGDSANARELMKSIHLFVKFGARWLPEDKKQANAVRRSLLKLIPDYTLEFIWILKRYDAFAAEPMQSLLRETAMRRHLADRCDRLRELLAASPADVDTV